MELRKFTGKQIPLHRDQIQRSRARPGRCRGRGDGQGRKAVKTPTGYHLDWRGKYESQKRSQRRLLIVLPITILVIYIILFTMFKSAKWAALTLANVSMAHSADSGAADYGHALQRVERCRVPGAVWSFRRGGRDHDRVHQSTARARVLDRRRGRGGAILRLRRS